MRKKDRCRRRHRERERESRKKGRGGMRDDKTPHVGVTTLTTIQSPKSSIKEILQIQHTFVYQKENSYSKLLEDS